MLDLTLSLLLLLKQNIGYHTFFFFFFFFAHNVMLCYSRLFNFGLLLNLFDVKVSVG